MFVLEPQIARSLLEAASQAVLMVQEAYAAEVAERRRFWIAGIPTEWDLRATRKAVARKVKTTPEFVEACLAIKKSEE